LQISKLYREGKVDDMLYSLARGPDRRFQVSNRCSINGFFFRSRQVEKNLTTQNSGIVVEGGDGMEWYGVLRRTIMLEYRNAKEVLLFECDWYDVPAPTRNKSRGYSKDEYGIIDIDTTRFRYIDEPYILATQAEQVCYVPSAKKADWCSVLRLKPRNLFPMPEGEESENHVDDPNVDSVVIGVENMAVEDLQEDLTTWSRNDMEGLTVDAAAVEEAVAASIPEPDDADIQHDEAEPDDTYIVDGVVPPMDGPGEEEDDYYS
jgi:hypothetical protein